MLAVVFYGIGDAGTTFVGLSLGGVTEAGPIAGPAIDAFGNLGLIAIKITLFFGFFAAWRALSRPGRVAIPLALVVVGALVTVWNTVMILSTL